MAGSWAAAAFAAVVAVRVATGVDDATSHSNASWHPKAAPDGPVVIVVSLVEQRAYVYRNGIAIGTSAISSGKRGHSTPAGVFTILQKEREHRSNLYDDAPMPFMERLTWDGIAIHAGSLPGYPASHGCIRLPHAFAERLFEVTHGGDTVVVSDQDAVDPRIVHPSVLAPVTPGGVASGTTTLEGASSSWWDDEATADGPVSILVSLADRRAYVMRNGVRIGAGAIDVAEGFDGRGAVVYVAQTEEGRDAGRPRRWLAYPLGGDLGRLSMDELARNLHVSDDFAARVRAVVAAGTSVLVTDQPAQGGEARESILRSDPGRGP